MLLDVVINNESESIQIDDPFHPDLDGIVGRISGFASSKEADLSGLDIRELIPSMIKGIAGCESGCPANAKDLVKRGVRNFELQYIEGGILSARSTLPEGKTFHLKMFPDF